MDCPKCGYPGTKYKGIYRPGQPCDSCRFVDTTASAAQVTPPARDYGYGIVDRHDNPWWEEACVCQDREPMDDQVQNLNDYPDGDDRCPYRVVRLRFEEA